MPGVWMKSGSKCRLDDFLDLDHRHLCGSRHVRVKIAGGFADTSNSPLYRLPGLDDREVRLERGFPDIELAVEFLDRLAFRHHGADTGAGVKSRDTAPPARIRSASVPCGVSSSSSSPAR